jgi:hypothetical protein
MARRRDYRAEYRRRKQLAGERGFASPWFQRRAPRRLVRASDFGRLPKPALQTRSGALRVLDLARSRRMTIEQAALELDVPVELVRWWLPEALQPTRRGRTLSTKGDRIARLRPLLLEDESELTFVAVRGSRATDEADRVFDVQWRFVTGQANEAELEQIRGVRVSGRLVESDPERLRRMGDAGAVDPEKVYGELIG